MRSPFLKQMADKANFGPPMMPRKSYLRQAWDDDQKGHRQVKPSSSNALIRTLMQIKATILGLELEVNGFQWSYAPLYDFFILEYNVKNVGSDTLEDVFMAFRYDVDISSNETGTASYSADDFVALDQTPDALNPVDHPNRYLSYGFSNASAPGYIGLRVLDAYRGDNPEDPTAKIPFTAHKRITISTDPTTDAEKYALISVPGVEPLPANYDDQRFIQSYGPVESFAPGESFNIIIAVAIGDGLAGLQASAD